MSHGGQRKAACEFLSYPESKMRLLRISTGALGIAALLTTCARSQSTARAPESALLFALRTLFR
jgi:hypothetical protein